MGSWEDSVLSIGEKYPVCEFNHGYGTAGFRETVRPELDGVFSRVGLVAALRSAAMVEKCGTANVVGVMVTASHNAEKDNGVKIVDCDAGMLEVSWEKHAEQLVNSESSDLLLKNINQLVQQTPGLQNALSKGKTQETEIRVIIGRDCRPHSEKLCSILQEGLNAFGATVIDLGECTTPVVHYAVFLANAMMKKTPNTVFSDIQASDLRRQYAEDMWSGFTDLVETTENVKELTSSPVLVDTAFGVGDKTVKEFLSYQPHRVGSKLWEIQIVNGLGEGLVNDKCGAEFVQKGQKPPAVGFSCDKDGEKLLCSFDGDGDRIVFHSFLNNDSSSWVLLDGDRIATLIAEFIIYQLTKITSDSWSTAASLASVHVSEEGQYGGLQIGVVQTAYANGASTDYLSSFNIPVVMAKTGVKFLHEAAHKLDIGVYFEANGHGTVVFSEKTHSLVAALNSDECSNMSSEEKVAAKRLQAVMKVINPVVGDALSDMLAVLAILTVTGLDVATWLGRYTELPSEQRKVAVPNKSALCCSADETYLVEPASLQNALYDAMKAIPRGRCFIRPSGTEDVVRIYAEAADRAGVERLLEVSTEALNTFFA